MKFGGGKSACGNASVHVDDAHWSVCRLQKKLTAMGLEMVNKDGATAEMQARIDELSR